MLVIHCHGHRRADGAQDSLFALSVVTLQAVTVVLWEVNSVYNIHSRVQPCPADEYVLLLNNQSFERGRIVSLRKSGWTYRRIAASVVCRCFQQWSVKYSHTRRPCPGRPRSTNARQERRIVRAVLTAPTASREEIRAHVATAVSPRTTRNRLLAAGLRLCVPLTRLQLTPRHRQA